MSNFENIKTKIRRAANLISKHGIMPDEVIDLNKSRLTNKIDFAEKMAKVLDSIEQRIVSCPSANDVFSEFARDAAIQTVIEMYTSQTSSDRQKAQERILDRSLGRAVDRSINVNMKVHDLPDEELNNILGPLLEKHAESIINIRSSGKRDTTSIIVEERREDTEGKA